MSIKVKDTILRCICCRLGIKFYGIVVRILIDKVYRSLVEVWYIIRVY